ncbi:MAG: hypothetical protein AABX51_03085 [Nanoarchaeota archaeon]
MSRKGQAAMEFLMTYGWAILVVLVVIAALAYFGVLDPTTVLPDRCAFPTALTCSDYLVSSLSSVTLPAFQFTFSNGFQKDIYVSTVNVSGLGLSANCDADFLPGAVTTGPAGFNGVLVSAATEKTFNVPDLGETCTFTGSNNKKFKYVVTVFYNTAGSTINKTIRGEIFSKRER